MTVSGSGGRPQDSVCTSSSPLPLAWQPTSSASAGHPQGLPGTKPGPSHLGVRACAERPTLKRASSSMKPPGNSAFGYVFFLHLDIFKGSSLLLSEYVTIKKGKCPSKPHRLWFHQKEQLMPGLGRGRAQQALTPDMGRACPPASQRRTGWLCRRNT